MATSSCALGPYLRRPELDPPPLDRDDREPEDFEPERPRELEPLERDDFFAEDFFADDFFAADFLAGAFFAAVFRDAPLLAERPPDDLRDELELRMLLDDFLLAVLRPELLLGIRLSPLKMLRAEVGQPDSVVTNFLHDTSQKQKRIVRVAMERTIARSDERITLQHRT